MENQLQPLNYCRQVVKMYDKKILLLEDYDGADDDEIKKAFKSYKLFTNKEIPKFKLPIDGILIDDPTFRGLDSLSQVRLPYKKIILEYERSNDWCLSVQKDALWFKKNILICEEYVELKLIKLTAWGYHEDTKLWIALLPVFISLKETYRVDEGFVASFYKENDHLVGNYIHELAVLYNLLNALACSNVKTEKLRCRKPPKGKKMDALPFDEYYALTIVKLSAKNSKGSYVESFEDRHAPREHLRRGHIRQLQDGRKIWVNAAVVNAGSGGKIRKNYSVA